MRKLLIVLLFPLVAFAQTPPNTVILTWDGVTVIEDNPQSNVGYRVYQQQQPCADVTAAEWAWMPPDIPSGTLTYKGAGLQDNRTYCWYVTAFTPLGESVPSNMVDKYLPFPDVTPAPFLHLAK